MRNAVICGALLLAAPHACLQGQTALPVAEILRFSLTETAAQIARGMGQPVLVNDTDPLFRTWYFQTDVLDSHDHSHVLLFRKSDGALLSVTRNYHLPVRVDALFPEGRSTVHYWPDAEKPQLSVLVREYDGDRVLLAMGAARRTDPTTQVMVIRRSALPVFFPWLPITARREVSSAER
ncbi:MAG TPA: hypothetical protein VFQ91_15275 [Bryobacteraceae bacterium]|nr:hypothetical protein [Bryobacteraceae bacterium]